MLQHPRTGSQRTASATRLHHIRHRPAFVQSSSGHCCKASCLGPSHTGGDSRHGGKCRRQATVQAERQIHATNVCIRTPSNTHTEQFSVCCSTYGKVSRHEGKSSKWFHPASLPMETVIWCFAAGVHVAMLEKAEKAHKRRRTVWS